jgi:hypothetical protein
MTRPRRLSEPPLNSTFRKLTKCSSAPSLAKRLGGKPPQLCRFPACRFLSPNSRTVHGSPRPPDASTVETGHRPGAFGPTGVHGRTRRRPFLPPFHRSTYLLNGSSLSKSRRHFRFRIETFHQSVDFIEVRDPQGRLIDLDWLDDLLIGDSNEFQDALQESCSCKGCSSPP